MHYKNLPECPLCFCRTEKFHEDVFFLCNQCKGILRPGQKHLSYKQEKAHYETHNNDVNDPRYQQFVSPITAAILEKFTIRHKGLDFGAGTGPVVSKVLNDRGYNIRLYDPFFHNNPELLERKYDYIVCCEVIEHFHFPNKEFRLLRSMLYPDGILFCMTHLYQPEYDFSQWYYKNDPTHVFIYQRETIRWIQTNFRFRNHCVENRLIKFAV
jgi:SAM-dependent methyltransferase